MTAKTPPDPFLWLPSAAAVPFLDLAARELAAEASSLVRLTAKLRKTLSSEQVHLVLEQIGLRRRAKDKFAAAQRMFFTPQALIQAGDEVIAAYKAARFPASGRIADLCCGIGGDLLGLAGQGTCVGVDWDERLVHFAQRNCNVTGRGRASAVASDAAIKLDPAADCRLSLREKTYFRGAKGDDLDDSAELEWLKSRGECRQQVAWFGSLTQRSGEKSAAIVDAIGGPRTECAGSYFSRSNRMAPKLATSVLSGIRKTSSSSNIKTASVSLPLASIDLIVIWSSVALTTSQAASLS